MRAVVAYRLDAPQGEKELALWMGIDEIVAELILDHDVTAAAVEDRFFDAIEQAMDDKVRDDAS